MDSQNASLNRILVAFSGGADSSALALMLKRVGSAVVLGHVDHQMRPSSGHDALRCIDLAKDWQLPIEVSSVVVDPATEAEARRMRYATLDQIADRRGCGVIATGHTLDDDAETVMMRQRRGGFALGIPAVRGRIVRPLINLRRADTHAFCIANGVHFVTDPTNENMRFTRNRIRKELTNEMVLELAALGRRNRLRAGFGERYEVATTLLAHGVEPKGGLLDDIQNKVVGRVGCRLSVSKGSWVSWEDGRLVVGPWPDEKLNLPDVQLDRGSVRSEEWGLTFTVGGGSGGDVAELDADVIGNGSLKIRQWQPGDRFVPSGMSGSKKLQDLFVDLKVPRRDRDRVPILVAGDRIAWVIGYRIDDNFSTGPGTKNVLRLTCVK